MIKTTLKYFIKKTIQYFIRFPDIGATYKKTSEYTGSEVF